MHDLFTKLGRLGRKTRYSLRNITTERVGFHTIWTKPNPNFKLADYELLTLIVSALVYRRYNGPMHLYTDVRGFAYICRNGLTSLYDHIHTCLDEIPKEINPKIFWAGGKIFAYQRCQTPAISIDLDAIIWKKLPNLNQDAVALHPEPVSWGAYINTERFAKDYNFPRNEWNWRIPAGNVGVLLFNDDKLKDFYTKTAIDFMLEASKRGRPNPAYSGLFGSGVETYIDEMVFAEQRLLTMCADKIYRQVDFFTDFDTNKDHIEPNGLITHLWNSKRGYKVHARARETYCNFLLNYIAQNHPEALKKLKNLEIFDCIIQDANVPVYRFSPKGDWTIPGEKVVAL